MDARRDTIVELANSPEAMQHGLPLEVPDPLVPADPIEALAAQLALRSEFLQRLASFAPPPPPATAQIEAVTPLVRQLRAELDALRRELRESVALHPTVAPSPAPSTPDIVDYVNDMLALAEARMELRMRALERRLLENARP
jgi:hypothetical protein